MTWHSHPRHWKKLKDPARQRRSEPTPAEDMLWEALRASKVCGINFRREHAIGPFVVDFYASAVRLIVEVDGPIHEQQQDRDAARQSYLESGGFRVLRFRNERILDRLGDVLSAIEEAILAAKR